MQQFLNKPNDGIEGENLFLILLDKYVQSTISPQERDEFFKLLASGEYDNLLEQHMLPYSQIEELHGTDIPASRAEEMLRSILSAEKQTEAIIQPGLSKSKKTYRWVIAASIAGAIIIVASFLLPGDSTENRKIGVAATPVNFMGEQVNNTSSPMKIQMEDGSIITLKPLSKIHFPSHFATDKREVYLEGEAFFEVSKNASRPFFVYYGNLVTHVLGTSFNVKTDKIKQLVEVSVVTGKVRVYENKIVADPGNNKKEVNGVILTPNQKVVYKEDKRQFTASLVNDPSPISEDPSLPQIKASDFSFKETSLGEVLKLLERNYGIEMLTASDRLKNCLFNGDISKYNLYTKLDVICQALNASYEINGTKILIKGPGCD